MTRNKGAAPAPPVRPKPSVKFSNSANANDGNSKVPLLLEKAIMKYVYSEASHPFLCSNWRRQGVYWSCSSTSSPGTLECLERGDVRSSSYNLRWVALTIGLYVLTRSSHVIRIGLNRSGTPKEWHFQYFQANQGLCRKRWHAAEGELLRVSRDHKEKSFPGNQFND